MSEHAAVAIPVEMLGPRANSIERAAGVIGAIGVLLCCAAFFTNRTEFFQSYIFAFLYWGGFAFGGLGVLLLHHVVGGRWGATIRRLLEAKMRTLPIVLLLFIPLLFGLKELYPWATASIVAQHPTLQHKQHYLNVPFFTIRALIYFAVFIFIGWRVNRLTDEQDRTGDVALRERMRVFSAPSLLVFVLCLTFAAIDWVLSAEIEFYSTIYGGLIMIGDVLQTFALSITVLILASGETRFGGRIHSKILHDLGNLMFAFTIFWTYLSVSQLIIVWPANLPQEIDWYLIRTNGFWKVVAAALACIMFVIPFLALLSQQRKRTPSRLIKVAIWLLCARVVDLFWLVEPTYRRHGFAIYWTDFAAFLGIGGVWVYVYLGQLRKRPLLPLRDPRVASPLREVHA